MASSLNVFGKFSCITGSSHRLWPVALKLHFIKTVSKNYSYEMGFGAKAKCPNPDLQYVNKTSNNWMNQAYFSFFLFLAR